MISGPQLDQRFVISRLVPNYSESQSIDIEIPPKTTEQTVVFILTSNSDEQCGDVDIVATIVVYEDENELEEEEEEEEHEEEP